MAASAGRAGTLIGLVPARDGVVITADSRSMTLGVACDDTDEIVVPASLPLSVVAASGTDT